MTRLRLALRFLTWWVFIALAAAVPVRAGDDGCHPIPVTDYSPTGIAGCVRYGRGIASTWGGPGAAVNACVYPWRDCQTVAVRSLRTGVVIVVTPTMYCDCYTRTPDERLIDLDPSMVAALGLDRSDGLFAVEVWPVDARSGYPYQAPAMPDTAVAQ